MGRRAAPLVLLASLAAAHALPAQTPAPVAEGERVRFRAAGFQGRPQGTVVERDAGSLTIRLKDAADPVRVRLDAFERLEVARGHKRHFATGAAVGFVPGFAFGFVAGGALGCDDQGPECSALGDALAVGCVLGAMSAAVGGLVGLLIKSDRWERVTSGPVRVSVVPLPRRGVSVALSIGF
jgi:hypothetical protein